MLNPASGETKTKIKLEAGVAFEFNWNIPGEIDNDKYINTKGGGWFLRNT